MPEALENEIRILRAHFWSERDPEGRAFVPLADAYLRKGDLSEAKALIEDGLGRLPDFASAHLVAARVHREGGDEAGVRAAVDRLLELDAENAAGLRMKAELFEEEGRISEALVLFRRAYDLNPEYDDLDGRIARLEVESREGAAPMEAPDGEAGVLNPAVPDPSGPASDGEGPATGWGEIDPDGGDPAAGEPGSLHAGSDALDLPEFAGFDADFEGEDLEGEDGDDPAEPDFDEDLLDLAWTGEGDTREPEELSIEGAGLEDLDDGSRSLTGGPEEEEPDSERGPPVPGPVVGSGGTDASTLSTADQEIVLEEDPGEHPAPEETGADRVAGHEVEGEEAEIEVEEDMDDSEDLGIASPRGSESPTVTRTLGELYFRQGLTGRAVEVFEQLVRRRPDDPELAARLAEIRERTGASPSGGRYEAEPDDLQDPLSSGVTEEGQSSAGDGGSSAEDAAPVEDEAVPVEDEARSGDEDEAEVRAPQWAEREPEDADDVASPFAWDSGVAGEAETVEVEASGAGAPQPFERSISGYLNDLLSWEPGAVPIESLDPAAVPIESLAPDADVIPGRGDDDGPTRGPGEADGSDAGGDLDDFQSWLRGLRS